MFTIAPQKHVAGLQTQPSSGGTTGWPGRGAPSAATLQGFPAKKRCGCGLASAAQRRGNGNAMEAASVQDAA
jgi:hypothetical protein